MAEVVRVAPELAEAAPVLDTEVEEEAEAVFAPEAVPQGEGDAEGLGETDTERLGVAEEEAEPVEVREATPVTEGEAVSEPEDRKLTVVRTVAVLRAVAVTEAEPEDVDSADAV